MYIHIDIYIYVYTCIYTNIHVCIYIYTNIHVYVYIYTNIHVCIYIYCTLLCKYIDLLTYTFIYMYWCVYIYIYMIIYVYIHVILCSDITQVGHPWMLKFSKSSKWLSSWSSHLSTQRFAFHDTWCFTRLVCFDKTPTAGKNMRTTHWLLLFSLSKKEYWPSFHLSIGDIWRYPNQERSKGTSNHHCILFPLSDRLTIVWKMDFKKHRKWTPFLLCMLLTHLW